MALGPTLVAAALVATLSFGAGWQVESWRCAARDKTRIEAELKAGVEKAKVTNKASEGYEAKKEEVRIKYVRTTKVVEKLVERPVYRNNCIDEDGLKAINEGLKP